MCGAIEIELTQQGKLLYSKDFGPDRMIMPAGVSWLTNLAADQPGLLFLGGAAITVIVVLATLAAECVLALLLLNITQSRAEQLPVTTR